MPIVSFMTLIFQERNFNLNHESNPEVLGFSASVQDHYTMQIKVSGYVKIV